MRNKLALLICFTCFVTTTHAQADQAWDKWAWLTGEWLGEGSGTPGKGSGSFSFKFDLDQRVLIRKNHTEYPATQNQLRTVHDDLMVIYPDYTGAATKAIYFDNEGHTINYNIICTDSSIVLLSDKTPRAPIFRLTYTLIDKQTVRVKFEMSQDGEKFKTYVEGLCKRKKG